MIRTTSTAIGLVLAITAAPVIAQTTYTFTDLDLDGNLELSQVEFDTFGREVFVAWDTDADANVDEDEFYRGVYDIWDIDRDGVHAPPPTGRGRANPDSGAVARRLLDV